MLITPPPSTLSASTAPACTRDELIARGLPIVRRLARRMARRLPAAVQSDDLVSSGHEGLVRAVDAFDPSRCTQFEAYAGHRIRGAMLDELRGADTVTPHGRRRAAQLAGARTTLERELGRPARAIEVAESVGISVDEYHRIVADIAGAPTVAVSAETHGDSVAGLEPDPSALLGRAQARALLARAIAGLPARDAEVLAFYYQHELTLAEIGRMLGVTESRVCQILSRAHAAVRANLEEAGVEAADILP